MKFHTKTVLVGMFCCVTGICLMTLPLLGQTAKPQVTKKPAPGTSKPEGAPDTIGAAHVSLEISGPLLHQSFYPKSSLPKTNVDVIFYDIRNEPTFQLVCSSKKPDDPPEHLTAKIFFYDKEGKIVHRVSHTIDVAKMQKKSDQNKSHRYSSFIVPQFNIVLTPEVSKKARSWKIKLTEDRKEIAMNANDNKVINRRGFLKTATTAVGGVVVLGCMSKLKASTGEESATTNPSSTLLLNGPVERSMPIAGEGLARVRPTQICFGNELGGGGVLLINCASKNRDDLPQQLQAIVTLMDENGNVIFSKTFVDHVRDNQRKLDEEILETIPRGIIYCPGFSIKLSEAVVKEAARFSIELKEK